ncbi:MAG: hypothetical protein D6706_02895 [Chloroflexi bacterium]|nr:MAG: hypothetical protein D6706_02895 [Chloroflexota bacterium]
MGTLWKGASNMQYEIVDNVTFGTLSSPGCRLPSGAFPDMEAAMRVPEASRAGMSPGGPGETLARERLRRGEVNSTRRVINYDELSSASWVPALRGMAGTWE